MEGLIEEGSEVLDEDYEGSILDAALIGAAQRVEHYEIAGYGTARAMAEVLGESEHVTLLTDTLEEEKETDEKLTELAQKANTGGSAVGDNAGDRELANAKGAAEKDKKPSKRVA
jgi:ferritin-like metal-binding protein YciE